MTRSAHFFSRRWPPLVTIFRPDWDARQPAKRRRFVLIPHSSSRDSRRMYRSNFIDNQRIIRRNLI